MATGLRRQGIILFSAVCCSVAIVVAIQLWLIAAALDAYFSQDASVLAPAAVASCALAAINVVLYSFLRRFDRTFQAHAIMRRNARF